MSKRKPRFKIKFDAGGMANTLYPSYIGTHDSGWTIEGRIVEDYYEWVNEFKATHPKYGIVEGDFEDEVIATSERAYKHFCEHHPIEIWDYQDI